MAIIGLGTDIVEIARISQSLARSAGLIKRVLTADEQAIYHAIATKHVANNTMTISNTDNAARYFAKRFAAKEAAAKALGTGIGRGVSFQHIQVSNNAEGAPQLALTDYAAELAANKGVTHIWLSITDEQAYAAATVILERQ
ncbi:holo-ACP synthase [Rheinheimera sp. D18]|uniref:holo-ACP synthase n=1 Tax=Rheinheimera sp. D18 TaxID=2545632 RepID=UPI00104E18CF|nr:holo-ACP synthase [Rheinheimera sp. D18]QBL08771.1 holo-ACP synthase [Rheinheimera sp. D18]